jgi:uncharacterized protein (TIGR00661 family)
MKIVYGVSGEGLGHVFEAIQVIGRLKEEGHVVKVLTYGDRAFDSLAALGPTRIEGIHLYFNERGMSLVDTVTRNLGIIPFYLRNWARLRDELAAFDADAFITAYEPFTTVAAHVFRRPLVSMDNQNEMLHVEPPAGTDMFAFRLARLATRICTHGADHYVVKSFQKPARHTANVHFVAPGIQREIRALRPTNGGHVLVYLTKANPALVQIMRGIDETFIVYCNNRVGQEGNITFKAKGEAYLPDLRDCKAIIGTTGFSLIADSIFLQKPYFGVPLKKQFEQTYNAQFLTLFGCGDFSEDTTRADLLRFLGDLQRFRRKLESHHLDPAEQEETLLGVLAMIRAEQGRERPAL